MADKLDKILNAVEKCSDKIADVDKRLIAESVRTKTNTKSIEKMSDEHGRMNDLLAEHIRRTDLLETHQQQQATALQHHDDKLEEALTPIKFIKTFAKLAITVASLSGAGWALYKWW